MFIQRGKLKGKAIDLSIPLCLLNRHTPDRRAATWDGQHYIGYCLDCGKKIRRKARNDWRNDWISPDEPIRKTG